MKKLLIVAPSRKMGGIERALSVLANEWAKQDLSVVYVSCLKSKPFYELHPEIQVEEPKFLRAGGVVNKIIFYPKLISYIRNQIKVHKPDRVLSFGDLFNPIVLLAATGLKVQVYISDRTSPDYKFPGYINFLKKWTYPKAAGFIAQTSRAANYKRKKFGQNLKIEIIPNALRELKFVEVEKENFILYVGRFAWEKGPQFLIEAFAKLNNPDWKLVMAGNGPLLPKMKILAQELNISDQVDFLGESSNVDELFSQSKIYVLPSLIEGFPNSLCEAMAAGLPSICFASIPHEELFFKPEIGIVCEKTDSKSLAKEIEDLINDQNLRDRIGENAKAIISHLEVSKIGNRYLKFMDIK